MRKVLITADYSDDHYRCAEKLLLFLGALSVIPDVWSDETEKSSDLTFASFRGQKQLRTTLSLTGFRVEFSALLVPWQLRGRILHCVAWMKSPLLIRSRIRDGGVA